MPFDVSRRVVACVLALAFATGFAACGDSADEKRLQAEELAEAREEGRQQAEDDARIERAEAAAAEAKRDVNRIKRERARDKRNANKQNTSGGSGASQPVVASGGSSSCGDGLSVNATTSCPFARAVRESFENSGGASVIEAYSPTTARSYTMTCSPGIPTVCRGGNNAVVYIR